MILRFLGANLGIMAKIAAVVFLISAGQSAIAWVRKETRENCNYEWTKRMADATEVLRLKLIESDKDIRRLEETLSRTILERNKTVEVNNALLAKQQETIPLSEACLQCRIDPGRLWVLDQPTPVARKSFSRKGSQTNAD